MAKLKAQAPDGSMLSIDVPSGADPSQYDDIIHDAVGHYMQSNPGALEAAGRGALRNFPLAQQAAAFVAPVNPWSEKKTYSEELSHLTQEAEVAKEAQPGAYGLGAAVGTLAPLAIPGVGTALKASPVVGNALFGATSALSDTSLTQKTGEAAGNALIGGAIGGVVGGAVKVAPKGLQFLRGLMGKEAPTAVETVETTIIPGAKPKVNLVNPPVAGERPIAPDFTPTRERIAASNIAQGLGGTPRQLLKMMGKNPEKDLNAIGEWMQTADSGKSVVNLMDRPGQLLDRVNFIHDQSGKKIGSIIENLGTDPVPAGKIKEELQQIAWHTIDPNTEAQVLKISDRLASLEKKGWLDWKSLNKLKGMIGEHIKDDPAIARAYGVVSDAISDMAESAGKRTGDASIKAALDLAKRDYHMSSKILPMLRYAEAKNLVGGPAGHFSLRGLLANMAGEVASPTQIIRNALLKSGPGIAKGSIIPAGSIEINPGVGPVATSLLQSKYGPRQQSPLESYYRGTAP